MLRTIAVAALLMAGASASAEGMMKEGLWRITTVVEMPGMPMQMPPQVHTTCLKKESPAPVSKEQNRCRLTGQKVSGSTVSWQMQCEEPEGTTYMKGSITYEGDVFNGTVRVKTPEFQMKQRISGKWIGRCPE